MVLMIERGHWVKKKSPPRPLITPYCNTRKLTNGIRMPAIVRQETVELHFQNAGRC